MPNEAQNGHPPAEYFTKIINEGDATEFQSELTEFLNTFVEQAGAELVSLSTSVVQQMSGLHFVAVVVIRVAPGWHDHVTARDDRDAT